MSSGSDDEAPSQKNGGGDSLSSRSRSVSNTPEKSERAESQTSSPGSNSSNDKLENEVDMNQQESDVESKIVTSPVLTDKTSKNSDDEEDKSISKDNGMREVSKSKSKSRSRSREPKRKRTHKTNSRSRSPKRSGSRSSSRKRRRSSRSPKRSRSRSKKRSRSPRRRSRTPRRRSRSPKRRRSRSRGRRSRSRGGRRSRSRSATPVDGARLHVAELDVETRKRDLEKLFEKYGRIREIWMARNPPCFAFVVFNRQRDADKALRETDGELIGHCRIKVTQARPRVRGGRFRGGGGYDPNLRCYQCGELGHFSRNCTDTKFGYKRPPTPPGGVRNGRGARRHSRSGSRPRRSRS